MKFGLGNRRALAVLKQLQEILSCQLELVDIFAESSESDWIVSMGFMEGHYWRFPIWIVKGSRRSALVLELAVSQLV